MISKKCICYKDKYNTISQKKDIVDWPFLGKKLKAFGFP